MEKKWVFGKTMESMTDGQIFERIQQALEYEIPNKIRPLPYLGGIRETVEYISKEVVARCPVTGLIDFYTIKIRFVPNELIPELKSLKYYFIGYENLPISHEHLVAKVLKEFTKVIRPKTLHIQLTVAVRGGIETMVEASYTDS